MLLSARADGDQLGLGGAVEVGAAIAQRALERAILVEDDAGSPPGTPRADSRQGRSSCGGIRQVQHVSAPLWRAWRDEHGEERRVLPVTHTARPWPIDPDQQAGDPQPQAQADRGRQRAVEDGEAARGAGDQDRLGQGAVQDDLVAGDAET